LEKAEGGMPEGKFDDPGGILGVAMETAGVAKVAAVEPRTWRMKKKEGEDEKHACCTKRGGGGGGGLASGDQCLVARQDER
jgi:hypothetical protein